MNIDVGKIFEDMTSLSQLHSKSDYESNMQMFLETRYALLEPLVKAENQATACSEFCKEVESRFKKLGKVRGGTLMDLNYFMIYYVFPSILTNEAEDGNRICDNLRDSWNAHFKASINYASFDTLMEGFQTKIFGIPVGKN